MFSKIFLIAMMIFSAATAGVKIGDKMPDFTLKNYDSSEYTLYKTDNARAIVVMFIATRCPVSNDYNKRMVEIYDEYSEKEVVFIGINSNKQEDSDEVKKHAQKNGFKFPVLKDWKNVVADQYTASVTPEIYVLSPDFTLLYHGRIDDSRRENDVTQKDLEETLQAVLAGEKIEEPVTKAFGCTIKRVD